MQFANPARDHLSVLRAEIENEDSGVFRGSGRFHTLRMSLRHAVFAGRITRRTLLRSNRALSGDTALQLILNFRGLPLFERVGAT